MPPKEKKSGKTQTKAAEGGEGSQEDQQNHSFISTAMVSSPIIGTLKEFNHQEGENGRSLRVKLFIIHLGPETHGVLQDLLDPRKISEVPLPEILDALRQQFQPKENKIMSTFEFTRR